jgi:hypothetical protein
MMATRLFGCYRASDANDPRTYIAAATATLACYPEPIVRLVCDPVSGLPSQDKWLPSIAEIRVACDRLMAPAHAQERRDRVRSETLARRDSSKAATGSVEHTRTVKSFKELGALWPRPQLPPKAAPADYTCSAPLVNTAEFANYLNTMREENPS